MCDADGDRLQEKDLLIPAKEPMRRLAHIYLWSLAVAPFALMGVGRVLYLLMGEEQLFERVRWLGGAFMVIVFVSACSAIGYPLVHDRIDDTPEPRRYPLGLWALWITTALQVGVLLTAILTPIE